MLNGWFFAGADNTFSAFLDFGCPSYDTRRFWRGLCREPRCRSCCCLPSMMYAGPVKSGIEMQLQQSHRPPTPRAKTNEELGTLSELPLLLSFSVSCFTAPTFTLLHLSSRAVSLHNDTLWGVSVAEVGWSRKTCESCHCRNCLNGLRWSDISSDRVSPHLPKLLSLLASVSLGNTSSSSKPTTAILSSYCL